MRRIPAASGDESYLRDAGRCFCFTIFESGRLSRSALLRTTRPQSAPGATPGRENPADRCKRGAQMFVSQILEVGIGLILVFLVVSLILTAVQECIEAVRKTRARDLEVALAE